MRASPTGAVNTVELWGGLGKTSVAASCTIHALYVYFRGLFIIDPKGILRQITINDLPVGRSVEETLRLVQAFQFTDKHGEGTLVR